MNPTVGRGPLGHNGRMPAAHSPASRRAVLLGAGILGSAALAGCDRIAPGPDTPTAAPSSPAVLPEVGWKHIDHDRVPDGGTLQLSVPQLPLTWNSHHVDGAVAELDLLRGPLGLGAEITPQGTDPDPAYIESALITAPRPLTIEFRYNPQARWEDGSPITVEDLISRWRACNGSDPAFEVASTVGWDRIESVEQTADEFSGRIVFSSPFADWLTVLHPDVPAAVTATPQAFNEDHRTVPPPSRGPFRVDSVDEAAGVVTLVRNEQWWGPPPRLERIVVTAVSSADAPAAFAEGRLHAVAVTTGDGLTRARSRGDAEVRTVAGSTWTHLTLNASGPQGALAEVTVREAIARGIDRRAIARAALDPLGAPVAMMNSLVHLPGQDGYQDSFGGLVHDPEAAATLLEDAGWPLEGETRSRDGQALSLALVVPEDAPSIAQRAELIREDLTSLGLQVDVQEVPWAGFFSEHLAGGDFDATTFSWTATRFPEASAVTIAYPEDSAQNYTGMADERIGEVVEELSGTLDVQDRTRLANEFSTLLAQTFTVIPLFVMPQVWVVGQAVLNLGPSRVERVDWTAVGLLP